MVSNRVIRQSHLGINTRVMMILALQGIGEQKAMVPRTSSGIQHRYELGQSTK
jgi:hypothetical protein